MKPEIKLVLESNRCVSTGMFFLFLSFLDLKKKKVSSLLSSLRGESELDQVRKGFGNEGRKTKIKGSVVFTVLCFLVGGQEAGYKNKAKAWGHRSAVTTACTPTGHSHKGQGHGQGSFAVALRQPAEASQRCRTEGTPALSMVSPPLIPASSRRSPPGWAQNSTHEGNYLFCHFVGPQPLVWALTTQVTVTKQPENVNDDTAVRREVTSRWQTWLPLGLKNRSFV